MADTEQRERDNEMITENERDRRAAAWLIEKFGAEAVAEAETARTNSASKAAKQHEQKRATDQRKLKKGRVLGIKYPPYMVARGAKL